VPSSCAATVIFGTNADPVTNEWASKMIGREKQFLHNHNAHLGNDDWSQTLWNTGDSRASAGMSEAWEYEVQPNEFARLRTGGPGNDWCVETIVYRSGSPFVSTGKNWMYAAFRQSVGGAK
jgi:hypothetical protein